MNWETVSIILATGIVTSGGTVCVHWLQDKYFHKHEDRAARGKYREELARKIRESLEKIQERILVINLSDKISNETKQKGITIPSEMNALFNEYKGELETKNILAIYLDYSPLLFRITNEKTKQAIADAYFDALLYSSQINTKTNEEVKKKIEMAFKELENFVTSAD
jgi:phosphoenolpyruvate synthase/pyruvate phosphate dikinase